MDEPIYQVKITLEEWQWWQRYRQLRKAYEAGKMLVEWCQERGLTWYLVGKPEQPNKEEM